MAGNNAINHSRLNPLIHPPGCLDTSRPPVPADVQITEHHFKPLAATGEPNPLANDQMHSRISGNCCPGS